MEIQGLQKMTLLDYPGKVACTVFLGGCDLRCPFCHNGELVEGAAPAALADGVTHITGAARLRLKESDRLAAVADGIRRLGGRVEERSFFDVAKRDFENRQAVNFAVRLDGKLIGEAVLYRFDCRGGAELGCRIDKAYAGNGYGTEAFAAVAEWGLYKIHLSRVVAKCYKENQASYKMLSACMRKKGEDDTFFYFEKLV